MYFCYKDELIIALHSWFSLIFVNLLFIINLVLHHIIYYLTMFKITIIWIFFVTFVRETIPYKSYVPFTTCTWIQATFYKVQTLTYTYNVHDVELDALNFKEDLHIKKYVCTFYQVSLQYWYTCTDVYTCIYINQWLNFSKSIQLYRHNELVLIHDVHVHVYQNECMNLLKSAYCCTVLY